MRIEIGDWQVRSYRIDDAPSLARHANNRNISRNMRDTFPYPYTLSDAHDWISLVMQQSPEANFAIASADEVIGGIGLMFRDDIHRRSAEIGYWLGEPFWGQGIATAALRAVTDHAFANYDLARLEAFVFEWNPASMRVLEKVGYVLEGNLRRSITKDGQTIDAFLFARVLE
ncbi:MAG: GNAT family N-acetyltransferase [Chloroflexi bacterium]|nr:GNAT family N-acetyltransferase [Chloroflexota bacterium]